MFGSPRSFLITFTVPPPPPRPVHVLFNGPLNEKGQYEFTVVSTNCNYPIYVFARDPVIYKQVGGIGGGEPRKMGRPRRRTIQRYEQAVQQLLEQRGIVNGIRWGRGR